MPHLDNIRQDTVGRLRALLADAGLPAPDEITHEPDSIHLRWHRQKVELVVDLSDLVVAVDGGE